MAAKWSEVRQRIIAVIEAATPDVAPSLPFVHHDEAEVPLNKYTEPGRLRRFIVERARRDLGVLAWGNNSASYDLTAVVRVGYCMQPSEEIDGTAHQIEDLKASDMEQIDRLLVSQNPFVADVPESGDPAIAGVSLTRLADDYDEYGGRLRTLAYGVQLQVAY